MVAALVIAAALTAPPPDPVLDFYRGTWRCEGTNLRRQRYVLTYRFRIDAVVPPVLRVETAYAIGVRRARLSGQMARTSFGLYVETGARPHDVWVSTSRGWRGDTLVWEDVLLPGETERNRLTVHRTSFDTFTELDQRLAKDGHPNRINTQASCRRLSR